MDLIQLFPPSMSYIQLQEKKKKRELMMNWKRGLPEYHIQRFVSDGLLPFLKKHGYSISISSKILVQHIESWAFCHKYLELRYMKEKGIQYLKWYHEGEDEEYDWYCKMIPESKWQSFMDIWQEFEFLDDSDVGNAQRCDFSWCIWHCISLESSKSHEQWKQFMIDAEEQEEGLHGFQNEDSQAYGGDRRTYS